MFTSIAGTHVVATTHGPASYPGAILPRRFKTEVEIGLRTYGSGYSEAEE